MRYLILSSAMFLVSCSSATLAPKEVRTVKFQDSTSVSKDQAYTSSLAYIAKNFGDANQVIKVKEKDAGLIVLRGNVTCNELRQSGDFNDYSLRFNLSINAKDKAYQLAFEDLQMLDTVGQPVRWGYNQMVSEENVKKVKPCLDTIRKGLLNEVNQ